MNRSPSMSGGEEGMHQRGGTRWAFTKLIIQVGIGKVEERKVMRSRE